MCSEITIGIDASRVRSGGGRTHLIGLLAACDPAEHNIKKVHVWSYQSLLAELPDYPWLVKHNPIELEQSLAKQLFWQATALAGEVKSAGCDILFATDASTLCRFEPMVVLSQDMLSYEPGVMKYFGYGLARLRLLAILVLQNAAFQRASGVIFLTRYAGKVIQQYCGPLSHVAFIPHGVGRNFQQLTHTLPWPTNGERPIRLLYISNAAWYKHQWIVIRAVEELRDEGINLVLTLVGGGTGPAQAKLSQQMATSDPRGEFVTQREFVPQSDLPGYLAEADIFVFASSCENLPNTLVEAMAAGLPIACSQRGPMPEILEDAGEYFDPEVPESITNALRKLIANSDLRRRLVLRAKTLSARYSWGRCAKETWSFVSDTYSRFKQQDKTHLT